MMKKITKQLFYKFLFAATLCYSFLNVNAQAPKVNSIERLTPIYPTTDADEVTFRVTFSDGVHYVTTDDFALNGTAAADGTVAEITKISDLIYDVKVTGLTNSFGTINLDIKGVDAIGSNDIKKINSVLSTNITYSQQHFVSFEFGQSFESENTALLTKITLRKHLNHTASGTGTLELFSGEGYGGNLLATENITVTSSTGEVTYTFSNPALITTGNTYTFRVQYSGTGKSSFNAKTGNPYANGYAYAPAQQAGTDIYFKIYVSSGEVLLSNTLPSTDETYTIENPPTIATSNPNTITQTSVVLGGNVTSDNGNSVTERGIIYATTDNNLEVGEVGVTKDTNGTGTGVFSETINDFTGVTTYYYRAYAINNVGVGYGEIKSFTSLGVSITAIERENPTLENIYENTVTYKVTFSKPVKDVDVSDFTTNAAGATISNVNQVSTAVYEVTVNNITANGDVFLQIKGVNGIAGSNNITTLAVPATTYTTVNQTASDDYLNQAKIGQTYTAGVNGVLKKITLYPKDGNHTFTGTADLKIYDGDETNGGVEIHSESINITNSTTATGQEFTLTSTVNVTKANTYSVVLTNFSGSGNHALSSNISDVYADGHVIFTGMNDSSHLDHDLKIKIEEEANALTGDMTLSTNAPTTNEKYTKLTTPTLPVVETTNATNVTSTSATLAGNIPYQGESAVTERGVLYSTTDTNPKIGDINVSKITIGNGTGVFSENITGLTANTIYYYRAYATNAQGTSYGNVKRALVNNALNFDGSNDRVLISDNSAFDFSAGFTAEAWIKANVLGTLNIFSQYSSNQRAFSLFLKGNGLFEFTANPSSDGSSEEYFDTTNTPITANTWHHVAITYDGSIMRAFVDGIAAGSESHSGTLFDSNEPIEIGARDGGHFFDGTIDEVRIWTRALTETEIKAQKDHFIPSNSQGLVIYYKMNQGVAEGDNSTISTIMDSSTNNLNGLFNHFAKTGPISNFVDGVVGTFENGVTAPNMFATTGNWSTPSNWSLGVVPTQIDQVIIASGQTVTIDVDDLTIDNFILENTAVLNIPKDKEITIQNSFVSNGTLELDSDTTDSGVLFVEGTSSGNITYKRGGLLANKWSIVTPPVFGQTVKTFAENAANDIRINTTPDPDRYAIGFYDDTQVAGSKWQYYDVNVSTDTEFTAGQSYAISRATDGEVSFTGTLTVENLVKTLVPNKWNAIGNPFTTYYPANKNNSSSFLNDNMGALNDAFKGLYVWDNAQNKYIAISEVDASNRSLPPGQGFFVFMKDGQSEISFNASKRSTKPGSGSTNFARNINTTPNIVLNMSNNTTTVKTNIKYFDTATQGLDPGYDIGNFNGASFDIYTHLLDNSNETNFTIQSLPTNNYENMVIPVGVNASQGEEITFTVEALNLPTGIDTYLEDRENNVFTQLSEVNTNYTIILENNVNGIGRFYIHTASQVLNTEDVAGLKGVNMYNINNTLKIHGLENEEATVKLYSILGKEIFSTKLIVKEVTALQLPNLTTGLYIIKLNTNNGTLNKKIILK